MSSNRRKKKIKDHLVQARIELDLYQWVEAQAEKDGLAVGTFIRQMLRREREKERVVSP